MTLNFQFFYGDRELNVVLPDDLVVWQQTGPATVTDLAECLRKALAEPIDYPLLRQAVIPGDRVALIVDPETPGWPQIVAAAGEQILQAGVETDSIQIVLNRTVPAESLNQARSALQFPVVDFEEAISGQKVYLASTADGERIYLPAVIAEADYTVTVGLFSYDDRWGYRGTHSAVYPAFVSAEEQDRLQGHSQPELTPESSRGLRHRIDEIGWLLGVQYSIQVIASQTGDVAMVLSGASDSVYRKATELLDTHWRSALTQRAETVVVSLPGADLLDPWTSMLRACRLASQLVVTEGRVVLLTSWQNFPADLAELLASGASTDQLLRKFNRLRTPDSSALHALLQLASQCKVYLLSGWDSDVVENLNCIPLSDAKEVLSSIAHGESYALLNGGQFAYIDIE